MALLKCLMNYGYKYPSLKPAPQTDVHDLKPHIHTKANKGKWEQLLCALSEDTPHVEAFNEKWVVIVAKLSRFLTWLLDSTSPKMRAKAMWGISRVSIVDNANLG